MTTSNKIALTFTQCKQIISNDEDIREVCESLNDQPAWLLAMGGIDSISEIQSINQGGCASGAFMPAVTYATASKVMTDYGDDILEYVSEYIEDMGGLSIKKESWSGLAVKFVSIAVELWCMQFDNALCNVDWA